MTSTIQVQIPESLLQFAEQLAAREKITVSQLVASAVSEKICAMSSPEYLEMRAQRGSLDKLREVMSKVPADPPVEGDEL